MSHDSSGEFQPYQVNPPEIIIEEDVNQASIHSDPQEKKKGKSNEYNQRNKPNDEYQEDYDEQDNKIRNDEGEEEGEEEYNEDDPSPHQMEAISEAEIEEEQRQNKANSQSNVLIQDDYNQVFDEIMMKKKESLIFKKTPSKQSPFNQFKPLTMMKKNTGNPNDNSANKPRNYLEHSSKSINTASNRPKAPIELALYDEAAKRRENIEKVEYHNMMNIILTSSKAKISNNSQKIAISKIEKRIEEVISKREKNKHLTFINIGEVLTELSIFREILPKSNNDKGNNSKGNPSSVSSPIKTYQSVKEVQKEMINVKENERRKQSEINFYEQFWMMINPGNKKEIKADMISEILKILFAPINANVKYISEILKQFLMTAFFLNCNPDEVKKYISPITEKNIPEEDIWDIEKVVREFLQLKENSLAYQHLKHFNKNIQNEIVKKEKEITFKPSIIGFGNDEKNGKWNYYEERLPALVERERLRQQVLEEMKRESEEADLKECTFKPEINQRNSRPDKNRKKSTEGSSQASASVSTKTCIYERLYTSNKGKDEKIKQEKENLNKEEEKKAMAECSFKPKLISQDSYQQSFINSEYPKGFQEYVSKMQNGIIEAQKKKYNEKRIPTGENYEKVKNSNIQPFNITDLQKKGEKEEGKKGAYFTIQIKIPSGKERTLKIYLKDDPYDVAEQFCKIYCYKEEIKERLAKTILSFRTIYLQRNHLEEH